MNYLENFILEERDLVADLRAGDVVARGNCSFPPINRVRAGVVVGEAGGDHLGRALARAERAFGIRSVGRVVDVTAVDLELEAGANPDVHRPAIGRVERDALRDRAAA